MGTMKTLFDEMASASSTQLRRAIAEATVKRGGGNNLDTDRMMSGYEKMVAELKMRQKATRVKTHTV